MIICKNSHAIKFGLFLTLELFSCYNTINCINLLTRFKNESRVFFLLAILNLIKLLIKNDSFTLNKMQMKGHPHKLIASILLVCNNAR